MDVTSMTREELEEALLKESRKVRTLVTQRDHYKAELDKLHIEHIQISHASMEMRNLAQRIIIVGAYGQDS